MEHKRYFLILLLLLPIIMFHFIKQYNIDQHNIKHNNISIQNQKTISQLINKIIYDEQQSNKLRNKIILQHKLNDKYYMIRVKDYIDISDLYVKNIIIKDGGILHDQGYIKGQFLYCEQISLQEYFTKVADTKPIQKLDLIKCDTCKDNKYIGVDLTLFNRLNNSDF